MTRIHSGPNHCAGIALLATVALSSAPLAQSVRLLDDPEEPLSYQFRLEASSGNNKYGMLGLYVSVANDPNSGWDEFVTSLHPELKPYVAVGSDTYKQFLVAGADVVDDETHQFTVPPALVNAAVTEWGGSSNITHFAKPMNAMAGTDPGYMDWPSDPTSWPAPPGTPGHTTMPWVAMGMNSSAEFDIEKVTRYMMARQLSTPSTVVSYDSETVDALVRMIRFKVARFDLNMVNIQLDPGAVPEIKISLTSKVKIRFPGDAGYPHDHFFRYPVELPTESYWFYPGLTGSTMAVETQNPVPVGTSVLMALPKASGGWFFQLGSVSSENARRVEAAIPLSGSVHGLSAGLLDASTLTVIPVSSPDSNQPSNFFEFFPFNQPAF